MNCYTAFPEAHKLDVCLPLYHHSTTKIGKMSDSFPLDGESSVSPTATAEKTRC